MAENNTARHFCRGCGEPLPPDYKYKRCDACRAAAREYNREYRARPGFREKRKQYMAERYRRQTSSPEGRAEILQRARDYYSGAKARGDCPCCGKQLPESYRLVLCPDCRVKVGVRQETWRHEHRDEYNKRQRGYYARRKAAHLCVKCGEPLPEGWTKVMCQACYDWQKMRRQARQAGE